MQVGQNNESNRVKWIEATLQKQPAGLKILDAGAGEKQFKRFCSHLDYYSQDFGKYDGKGDGTALQMGSWDQSDLDYVSDITDIPVENDSFDLVLCTEVFEHLPDPVKALNELARIVKPGGKIIITAPFNSLTHFSPYHFSSGFNRFFYEHHFARLGFQLLECTANGNYFEYLAQELRRIAFVAKNYSYPLNRHIIKPFIGVLLIFLSFLSKHDRGSESLLCFGYHVIAQKKN
jgi:SAM-dependent methyltransferase